MFDSSVILLQFFGIFKFILRLTGKRSLGNDVTKGSPCLLSYFVSSYVHGHSLLETLSRALAVLCHVVAVAFTTVFPLSCLVHHF